MRWFHVFACFIAAILGAMAYHLFITAQPTPPAPAPPIVQAPVQPPPKPPALPQATLEPLSPDQQVLSLFLPEEKELEHQHQQSTLTAHMEQTLVITYMLTNCGLLSEQNYAEIYRKLGTYLAQTTPDSVDLLHDASERARASYQFVYRRIPCDDAALPPMANQLRDWSTHR